jgi:aspartokinase-like uncharacterized kinase
LAEVGQRNPLLVVPGGGPFAETVRALDRRYGLQDSTAHWMAIQGMDQYGRLLAGLIPGSEAVDDLAAAPDLADAGRVPVLLPYALLRAADPVPHSWDVTSDSIAAWVSGQIGVSLLVLLKDVDGLMGELGTLQETMTREQLARCGGVDRYLPELLPRLGLEMWAINGQRPQRLVELLGEGTTTGTRWLPPGP